MKKIVINISIIGYLILCATISHLSALNVSVTHASYDNNVSSYLELYFRFDGNTCQWTAIDLESQYISSQISYQVIISKDDQAFVAEKYILTSPEKESPTDFWDSKRYQLESGTYSLDILFIDANSPSDSLSYTTELKVNPDRASCRFSDVLFMSVIDEDLEVLPFNKANFSFEPLAFDLVDKSHNSLTGFFELYNASSCFDEDFILKYYYEKLDVEGLEKYSNAGYKKLKPTELDAILIDIPMSDVKSGNYILHLELNDKNRRLIKSTSKSFSVYHPVVDYRNDFKQSESYEKSFVHLLDRFELNYALKAVFPRLGQNFTDLINQIIAGEQLEPKRYFLHSYWTEYSLDDPKSVYDKYMEVAKAVDFTYANNVGHGFETDRGYIFLKYGKPDDLIAVEDEPSAPPYEIWIYNYVPLTQQTNVRFLFYNPSLSTNDFKLLHSTCRGERNNPRWEMELYDGAYNELPNNFIDGRTLPDGYNRNARKIFDDY